jgi:hypothetical protein
MNIEDLRVIYTVHDPEVGPLLDARPATPGDILALLREWGAEEVWWCEGHKALDVGLYVQEGTCTIARDFRMLQTASRGRVVTEPTACRMVERLLVPVDVLAADTGKEQ